MRPHPSFIRTLLALAALPLALAPIGASAGTSPPLSTNAEVTEALMVGILANGQTLARLIATATGSTSPTFAPLTLTGNYGSTYDTKSFAFAANPLTYAGQVISSFGSGRFDSASGTYLLDQNTGSFGDVSFAVAGSDPGVFNPDPSIRLKWPIKVKGITVGEIDLEAAADFGIVLTPNGTGVTSAWKYSLTWNGAEIGGGKGSDKYDPMTGKWTTAMLTDTPPTDGLAYVPFKIEVVGTPTTADGSAGTYVATITPVPEPQLLALLLPGAVLVAWRRRGQQGRERMDG